MAQTTVNPYEEIGGYIPTGLANIIASLPGSPTIDQLVSAVATYIEGVFYTTATTQVQIEIKSVARTAINSYVNNIIFGGQTGYNANQMSFISLLIGTPMTSELPIVSIANRIEDVEDNITDSGLTVGEQTALLLATTIGSNANTYWAALPAGWNSYYPPTPEKYMDIPYYVAAAMNGSLAGYGATFNSQIEPSINHVTNKMVSALIGALTVTAGKVIYQWIPRIQKKLSLNAQTVSALNNMGGGTLIFGVGGGVQASGLANCTVSCNNCTDSCNSCLASCLGDACPTSAAAAPGKVGHCLGTYGCNTCATCYPLHTCIGTCGANCPTNGRATCEGPTCQGNTCPVPCQGSPAPVCYGSQQPSCQGTCNALQCQTNNANPCQSPAPPCIGGSVNNPVNCMGTPQVSCIAANCSC